MSAPAAAAGSKRARPDPICLLWTELEKLEASVVSDLRIWAIADIAGTERRRNALTAIKSINGTQGWASTTAITDAVDQMDAAYRHDNGHRWCEDARVRLGTIRLLLNAQSDAKKARDAPPVALKQVVQFVHIHTGDESLLDSIWTLPVHGAPRCDLAYIMAMYTSFHNNLTREAGCLAAMFVESPRKDYLECSADSAAVFPADEVVVWRVPIYHDHGAPDEQGMTFAKCMLCKE